MNPEEDMEEIYLERATYLLNTDEMLEQILEEDTISIIPIKIHDEDIREFISPIFVSA